MRCEVGESVVRNKKYNAWLVGALALVGGGASVWGRGVSPYLPLGVSPEIERQFERVLILAGKPVVRRPIPAAVVLDALPAACALDQALCREVRTYLGRYERNSGVTQLRAELSATTGDSERALPNEHGETLQSKWQAVGNAFYQAGDHLAFDAGVIAYQGRVVPTGTMLSAGSDFAQLDIGFRDHWWSPLSTGSLLMSTEAPTTPSVTVSNYRPLTPLGITYEFFATRMTPQKGIEYLDGTTSGRPYLTGLQIGVEPVTGYALTANKIMQFGGGARGGVGFTELRKAIFINEYSVNSPDGTNGTLEFGNQVASVASTMQFPGRVPFSASIEYAGEDYLFANDGNYRLGESAVSFGLDFPRLWQRYDLKYEVSEWQNAWYIHHIYPDGLTNNDFVVGHWFGDQRRFGDPVGGHSVVVQGGLHTDGGDYWQATYRTLAFTSTEADPITLASYKHLQELGVRYSTRWHEHDVGAELLAGRDALGERYGRLSVSLDLLEDSVRWSSGSASASEAAVDGQTKFFVDMGFNRSRVHQQISLLIPDDFTPVRNDYHFGAGARRAVAERSDLGVRVELDRIGGHGLLSLRALDYRFRPTTGLAIGAFAGVGRYNYGQAAFGWYGGIGTQLLDVLPKWDVGFDWRYYDKLSRNRIDPSDPPSTPPRPRLHFDVKSLAFYISRKY